MLTAKGMESPKRLAGVGGFEPPNAGSKDPCLTAWRHPKHPSFQLSFSSLPSTIPFVLCIGEDFHKHAPTHDPGSTTFTEY